MKTAFVRIARATLILPVAVVTLHTVIRIVRHFVKFPVPEVLADLIDNPMRRRMQPPDLLAERHGVRKGMTVLDVGPGNGRYTLAAARAVGPHGHVHAIDLEPRMIHRVQQRAADGEVDNIEAQVADVYALPYPDDFFDVVYMITVTGEIPEPIRMLRECRRVLKPAGTLGISELLTDPDYPFRSTVMAWAAEAGFQPAEGYGTFFSYTLTFTQMGCDRSHQRVSIRGQQHRKQNRQRTHPRIVAPPTASCQHANRHAECGMTRIERLRWSIDKVATSRGTWTPGDD